MELRQQTSRRGIGLTPMIDVVFLLLIFFMLVSRFERPVSVELESAFGGVSQGDVPRLVDVEPDAFRLNGVLISDTELVVRLSDLVSSRDSIVVLRPSGGTNVQRLLDASQWLNEQGFEQLAVIE